MEKFKTYQPIIIVILICLSLVQFIQINNMRKEIADLEYQTSELESKVEKLSGKDFDYEFDQIKDRLSTIEGNIQDLDGTVSDMERKQLYRDIYRY